MDAERPFVEIHDQPKSEQDAAPRTLLGWLWRAWKWLFWKCDRLFDPLRLAVERSSMAHLVAIGVAAYTVYQIHTDLNDRESERNERKDARIERAFERLTQRNSGQTGKGDALNTLIAEKERLNGVILSCKNIGDWDNIKSTCENSPVFSGIDYLGNIDQIPLGARTIGHDIDVSPIFNRPTFDEVIITDSNFTRSIVNIRNTDVFFSSFKEGIVGGLKANDSTITQSDLRSALVGIDSIKNIHDSNVSGMIIIPESTQNMPQNYFDFTEKTTPLFGYGNWAWADNPPVIAWPRGDETAAVWTAPPNGKIQGGLITLCDPTLRIDYRPENDADEQRFRNMFAARSNAFETYPRMRRIGPTERYGDDGEVYQRIYSDTSCWAVSLEAARLRWPNVYDYSTLAGGIVERWKSQFTFPPTR